VRLGRTYNFVVTLSLPAATSVDSTKACIVLCSGYGRCNKTSTPGGRGQVAIVSQNVDAAETSACSHT
jgi:hypothetical protein